jgi:hypothetical protein
MPARYTRVLAPAFARQLASEQLEWITTLHRAGIGKEPWALDPQFRERSTYSLYHGTTRLLDIKFKKGNGEELVFWAAQAYGEAGAPSASAHASLMKSWPIKDAAGLEDLCREYLAKAIDTADVSKYQNRKEGYWQNRLALCYGGQWDLKKDWLIFDREVALGYANEEESTKAFAPVREKYEKVIKDLQAADPARFGTTDFKVGNAIDLLALGPSNELVCIELKHGTNAAGVFWGAVQASAYRELLEPALPQVLEGIRRLVQQKVALGLLPPAALLWVPEEKFSGVQAALAVAEPNPRSDCWKSLELVQERLGAAKASVVSVTQTEGGIAKEPVGPKGKD